MEALKAPTPWVVCAALRHRTTQAVICSARHFDPLMQAQIRARAESEEEKAGWKTADQGFINQKGNFLTREEARALADANGQIRRRCGGDAHRLFSENLY